MLTPDELAEIRTRAARNEGSVAWHDRRALLAHIDALADAVEARFDQTFDEKLNDQGLVYSEICDEDGLTRDAILRLLRP